MGDQNEGQWVEHPLAQLIRERQKALGGLSDREVAKRAGLSASQVSRWVRNPAIEIGDDDKLRALAEALEVSPDVVFAAAVESVAEARGYRLQLQMGRWAVDVASRAESLTPEDRRMLEQLLERMERSEQQGGRRRKS